MKNKTLNKKKDKEKKKEIINYDSNYKLKNGINRNSHYMI